MGSIYTEYAKTHKKGEGFPYKVEGIGGDKIPTSLHFDVIDEWAFVSDAEAFQTARRLTREEGLFTGGSTGVNVKVALDVARALDDPEAMVVTILCDTGERYLSKLYDDNWMRENQLLETRARHRGHAAVGTARRPAAARLRGARGERAPGPQPHGHVQRLADPGGGRPRNAWAR